MERSDRSREKHDQDRFRPVSHVEVHSRGSSDRLRSALAAVYPSGSNVSWNMAREMRCPESVRQEWRRERGSNLMRLRWRLSRVSKSRAQQGTLGTLLKYSMNCHPEHSEGSAVCRKSAKTADLLSPSLYGMAPKELFQQVLREIWRRERDSNLRRLRGV